MESLYGVGLHVSFTLSYVLAANCNIFVGSQEQHEDVPLTLVFSMPSSRLAL